MPAIIDGINNLVWIKSSQARFWVSVFVCALFGVGVNYIEHNGVYLGLDMLMIADSFGESILAMFGIAQLSYKMIWENSSMRSSLSLNMKENAKPSDRQDLP